jgi:hypothetical protein
MLPPDKRQWCLEQAIEIIKLAPSDSLATHDRLKRVYKRLVSLSEDTLATAEAEKREKPDKAERSKKR